MDTRKLITATMFGVAIAVVKGPFQPPYADFLIIVEAPILGLSFFLLGRVGLPTRRSSTVCFSLASRRVSSRSA